MKNSRWYKEGVEARKATGPVPACPYSEKSPKALIWLEGFNASACSLGSACNCGGDLPRVREGCANWVPQI